MPTEVNCERGHVTAKKLGAFREFAATGGDPRCRCGGRQRILVKERYPADPDTTHEFEVIRIARLYNDREADIEGYDKMLVMSKRRGSNRFLIKPMYWAKNRKGNWSYGQYPAALEPLEWRKLFKTLEMTWVR